MLVDDTGQSGLLVENAKELGAALSKVKAVVLSHGHRDHTGGLLKVLEIAEGATVLDMAALYGHREIATFLICKGCEVTLHVAAALGQEDKVRELLAAGADVNARGCRARRRSSTRSKAVAWRWCNSYWPRAQT